MIRLVVTLWFGLAAAMPLSAQSWQYWSNNPETPPDVAGASDPAGLQRIAGATIVGYETSGFDAHEAIIGIKGGTPATQGFEGPRHRVLYVMPTGFTPLEVLRNYQSMLEEQGYAITFECRADECGGDLRNRLYPMGSELVNYGDIGEYAMVDLRNDQAYLAAYHAESETSVTVFAGFNRWDLVPQIHERTVALVDVVGSGFVARMETVTRDELSAAMASDGRIALQGVFFETDSDTLLPDSRAALTEIAAFLSAETGVNAYIVGHTDAVGALDYNMDLSQRRAASIVAALVSDFGIDRARIVPAGVGPLAPQASNATEEGRALNRRVELVQR